MSAHKRCNFRISCHHWEMCKNPVFLLCLETSRSLDICLGEFGSGEASMRGCLVFSANHGGYAAFQLHEARRQQRPLPEPALLLFFSLHLSRSLYLVCELNFCARNQLATPISQKGEGFQRVIITSSLYYIHNNSASLAKATHQNGRDPRLSETREPDFTSTGCQSIALTLITTALRL
jgi:hypothetical protein